MSLTADLLARIAACGLDPAGIAIRYENELQSEVVTLRSSSRLGDAHFDCLLMASAGAFLEFEDKIVGVKYEAFKERELSKWMRSEAAKWLKANNKLEGAPVISADQSLKQWAEKVEKHCEFHAGEALLILGSKQLTMKSMGVEAVTDPRMACLFYVISLSDLKTVGVEFGFIGNEAYVDDAK